MNRLLILSLATLLLAACSASSDSVPAELKNIPVPVDPGDNQGTEDETPVFEPQSLPDDVPALFADTSYHGKQKGAMAEPVEFTLQKGQVNWTIDVEYIPEKSGEVNFTGRTTFYLGSCGTSSSTMEWMEVSPQGHIWEQDYVGPFDVWSVAAGKRYLLRVTHRKMSDCQSVYHKLTIDFR